MKIYDGYKCIKTQTSVSPTNNNNIDNKCIQRYSKVNIVSGHISSLCLKPMAAFPLTQSTLNRKK